MPHRPAQITRLIGRHREVTAILAALRNPKLRLVTLTGAGGMGKTRVAAEAATLAQADFRDGVFFISLGAARDPSLVASIIARTLGMAWAHEPLVDVLAERLAGKNSLLVLDTFEQVLDAAPLVAELLARCPGLEGPRYKSGGAPPSWGIRRCGADARAPTRRRGDDARGPQPVPGHDALRGARPRREA